MSGRTVLLSNFVVAGVLGLGMVTLVASCQKEKPAAAGSGRMEPTTAHQQGPTSPAQTQPASVQQRPAQEQTAAIQPVAQVTAEQTTCPVMGGPIDKSIFVEYKGKKVYFCCKGCVAAFQKEPEKYLAKLPQFAQ